MRAPLPTEPQLKPCRGVSLEAGKGSATEALARNGSPAAIRCRSRGGALGLRVLREAEGALGLRVLSSGPAAASKGSDSPNSCGGFSALYIAV